MDHTGLALPPMQERSRKTAERALEASIEVIGESGWAGFTMPAVSLRAGVSVPLLHRRFGSKDDLFLAAQASVLEQMEVDVLETYASAVWDGLGAPASIALAIREMADFFTRYAGLLRAFHERGVVDPRVGERAESTIALMRRSFSAMLLEFRDEFHAEVTPMMVDVCFVSVCAVLNHEVKFHDLTSGAGEWEKLVESLSAATSRYLLGEPIEPPRHAVRAAQAPAIDAEANGTRDRLLKSGAELLSELGYQGLTAVAVTRLAGLSVRSIYSFFESKDDLVSAIEQRALADLLAAAVALRSRPPESQSPADRAAFAIDGLVQLTEGNRAALRVLMARRPVSQTRELASRVLQEVQELFEQRILGRATSDATRQFAARVCFLVAYAVLSKSIPVSAYLDEPLDHQQLRDEQARLCAAYLDGV